MRPGFGAATKCQGIKATVVFVYLPVMAELTNVGEAMTSNEQYLSDYCKAQQVSIKEFLLQRRY